MELSYDQKQSIVRDGFVKIPGVVPRVMVDRALREINQAVGEGMDTADMTRFRAQTYCPQIARSQAIGGLLNATPAWSLAESVIGEGRIQPTDYGQIALRFPGLQDPPGAPRPHIDGMYSPTNGVEKGTIGNFTALAAIFLSDVPNPFAGNFTVWPGTHRLNAEYFKEHGPESLLKGMPAVELPEPVQITGQAGDMVLAHYLLSHGVAANTSPHVRYAVFFRLTHVDHGSQKWESMVDPWLQWEGIPADSPR